ncbi:hypothetical protein N9838_00720 [Acidimicrobiia bacterium]|nr:hypothetical protein [Acidimicrobiia bacterium]
MDNFQNPPILLILFNRVEIVTTMLNSLKKIKPEKLYIYFDGPRIDSKDSDEASINRIEKNISKYIDWECDLKIKKNNQNFGSHTSPKLAIDWLFSNEEIGVILEDDCIPNKSFYKFCTTLLKSHVDDKSVFMISGDNGGQILNERFFCESDYLFTHIPLTWGWATWKDRWDKVETDMNNWNQGYLKNRKYLSNFSFYESFIIYKMLNRISSREEKNWDYILYSFMTRENYLSIIPKHNLIQNIGWGEEATHTNQLNFRSYGKTKESSKFRINYDVAADKRTDMVISYLVHFGVPKKIINLNNFAIIRSYHFLLRANYLLFKIYKKIRS